MTGTRKHDQAAPGARAPGAKRAARQDKALPAAGTEAIRRAAEGAALPSAPSYEMPHGFAMETDGLWRDPGDGRARFRVCGPFNIIAETRPEDGEEWGLLLQWNDRDGKPHEWNMPRRILAGEAVQVREHLAACGLDVSATEGARRALVQFLAAVRVPARMRTVPHTGWHQPKEGKAVFVLPGRTIGNLAGEIVRLSLDPLPTIYQTRGSLDAWQRELAARCVGNSRLIFGVACGFAAPLLRVVGVEGGGFNLRGESSKGKTTIIDAAASVWGAPSKSGADSFVRQWRTTSNALESTAAAHNDVLLPMDEMGQADPKEVPETLYMLAHGTGKDRARAGGGNRKPVTFLTLVLSSAEESAARLAEQAGRRMKAGQEVRLLDIPAIVAGAFGCFEDLHGTEDGAAFAQVIRSATREHHGVAGPAFVAVVVAMMGAGEDMAAAILDEMAAWVRTYMPKESDGQVKRAAQRLALVAVAGEMAARFGIVPWKAGAASAAVASVFRAWMDERGGTGSREDMHLLAAVRRFIAEHGSSRFEPLRDGNKDDDGAQVEPALPDGPRTINRAGWRWQEVNEAGERLWLYGMVPEVFDREVAGPLGMEGREARARLGKAGIIRGERAGGETRWTAKTRVPGHGRPRLIVVQPAAVQGGDDH
jgi:uncharacterized protein (DUF927 family)